VEAMSKPSDYTIHEQKDYQTHKETLEKLIDLAKANPEKWYSIIAIHTYAGYGEAILRFTSAQREVIEHCWLELKR
jgi:hypothetical protein